MSNSAQHEGKPRVASAVILFVLTFAVAAIALSTANRRLSPPPYMTVLSPKLEGYAARAAEFDTVFIGTSRTLYHIIPNDVETAYATAGCGDISVFNFGVHGLTGAEQDWLIEQVLHMGAGHAGRLIIESPLAQPHRIDRVTSDRGRWFHGPEHWPAIIDNSLTYAEAWPRRIFRLAVAGIGAGYDLSATGYFSNTLFPKENPPPLPDYNFSEEGFEALDEMTHAPIVARREAFQSDQSAFHKALLRKDAAPPTHLDDHVAYLLQRLERIRAAGLETGLYVSPDVGQIELTSHIGARLAETAPQMDVFNFNQIDTRPEFFDVSLWHDLSHMGRQGASMLSRQLGAAMCEAETSNAQPTSAREIARALR